MTTEFQAPDTGHLQGRPIATETQTSGSAGRPTNSRERKPTWHPEYVRDISERVYRARLEQECAGNVERMLEKDADGGDKLRNRAAQYDPLTRAYLAALGFEPSA